MNEIIAWIKSGLITEWVPFFVGQTGIASGWVVVKQKANTTASNMTTPTISEDSFKGGLYRVLVDESTTLTSGRRTETLFLLVSNPALPGIEIPIRVILFDKLPADIVDVLGGDLNVGGSAPASPIGY